VSCGAATAAEHLSLRGSISVSGLLYEHGTLGAANAKPFDTDGILCSPVDGKKRKNDGRVVFPGHFVECL
jgi:hypothetical protein